MFWLRKRRWVLCFVLFVVAALTPQHTLALESSASYHVSECLVNVPQDMDIECGMLTVPEDHNAPDGKQIELPVIIIRGDVPETTPVLFTEGGPGFTSLDSVWVMRDIGLWRDRDVIILEQRGNIHANPSLFCDVSVWWEESPDNLDCLNRLHNSGINLRNYTMQQSVEDIEALRLALNIEAWNLFGSSYSTRLFLLLMDTYPENIRSAILDSVTPPHDTRYNHDPEFSQRVLDTFFQYCSDDVECSAAYPDLEKRFIELVEQLNDRPVTFTIAHDASGYPLSEPFDQNVTGYTMIDWMLGDAFYGHGYGENKTPYLPLLIDLVSQGHYEYLYPWLSEDILDMLASDQVFSWGYYFAINCRNEYPLWDEVSGLIGSEELDGYVRYAREREICESWQLSPQPVVDGPVKSDIPTLVLAGNYDPVTAPEWGQVTAANMAHAYYLEFPAEGHGVMGKSKCAQSIGRAFLNNLQRLGDTSCIEGEPAPEFVMPDDVALAPGLWGSVFDIDFGTPRGKTWLEIPVIICLFLFIGTLVGELVTVIVRRVKRSRDMQKFLPAGNGLTTALMLVTSLVGLSIPIVTTGVNRMMWSYPIMRYFGVMPGHPLVVILGILSPLFVMLHAALIWRTVSAWLNGSGTLLRRIQFSGIVVFSIAMTYLIFKWDLITILFS